MQYTIKQARLLAGKTQEQMAKALDIHVQTYRKIEKKSESATIEQAKKIAEETRLTLDDIFF